MKIANNMIIIYNIMIERLLKPYDDALNFLDHILMGILYIDCQDDSFRI